MKEVFEKLVQYLGTVGTDTSVSSWREMQSFASHPWSGDSSTMALLTRKDSKTSPYSLLRVKQTFLQTMLLFSDTVHSSLPAARKYEGYIFFFRDRVALLWTLECQQAFLWPGTQPRTVAARVCMFMCLKKTTDSADLTEKQ